MRAPKKHLFFIDGPVATPEQEDEADKLGGFVCFRNARMIAADEGCEDFDFLHGDVPVNYQRAAVAKERGEAIDAAPLSEAMGATIDNGDGTKTTTTVWRPNTATA
jgi:hypothetical protein